VPDVVVVVAPVFSPLANLAFALRREVFIDEQQVQDDEFDADDLTATHLVALAEGAVVGTLRIILEEQHTRIGRVAVRRSWRGHGIGSRLMARALELARERGESRFWLSAQADKADFYQRFGFVPYGEPEDDGSGILHLRMKTY
jgi:predicted GNAT family N-acyltransferase